jgi:Tfp pilus assembly protein PilN
MKTINLLPKSKQQDLRYELFFRSLIVFFQVSAITFLVVFAGQFLTRIYLSQALQNVNSQIESIKRLSNKEENTTLKNQIKLVNNQITDYKTLAEAAPHWSRVLKAFAADVPDGVQVVSFVADSSKKQITINGSGKTRDDIITLYNNINNDQTNFSNIDYPLENVSRPTNAPFHFTFTIRDTLLK